MQPSQDMLDHYGPIFGGTGRMTQNVVCPYCFGNDVGARRSSARAFVMRDSRYAFAEGSLSIPLRELLPAFHNLRTAMRSSNVHICIANEDNAATCSRHAKSTAATSRQT